MVKAARARACDALRHACNEQAFSPAAAATAAAQGEAGAGGDGGGGDRGASEAIAVAVVAELLPLVLSLAGTTVEGARCLRSLFAAKGGVGEAAQAAVLSGGRGGRSEAAGGIRAIIGLLVRRYPLVAKVCCRCARRRC